MCGYRSRSVRASQGAIELTSLPGWIYLAPRRGPGPGNCAVFCRLRASRQCSTYRSDPAALCLVLDGLGLATFFLEGSGLSSLTLAIGESYFYYYPLKKIKRSIKEIITRQFVKNSDNSMKYNWLIVKGVEGPGFRGVSVRPHAHTPKSGSSPHSSTRRGAAIP